MSEKNLLTTAEVAKKLNVTRRRINAMIQDNRLKATKFGQIFLIDEKDLKEVLERKPGRPAKEQNDAD
jgi:excisionase family DNA binding protein